MAYNSKRTLSKRPPAAERRRNGSRGSAADIKIVGGGSPDDQPSGGYVVNLASRLKGTLVTRDSMIDMLTAYRYLEVEPVIPPAFDLTPIRVRAPIINDQISRLVGQLTFNPPTWHVPPSRPGPEEQKRISKLEKAAKAIWTRLEQDTGKNLHFSFTDRQVNQGQGIYQCLLRLDRWDMPARKDGEEADLYLERVDNWKKSAKLPFSVRVVDRKAFYYIKDDDGFQKVLEVTRHAVDDIVDEYGADDTNRCFSILGLPLPEDNTYEWGHKLTVIQYWDRTWCVVVVSDALGDTNGDSELNGAVLKAFKHGYGRVPYFVANGEETGNDDPNYEALPMAFPLLYLAPLLDSALTQWANIGYLTSYPTLLRKRPPGVVDAAVMEDSDEEPEPVSIAPGDVVDLRDGESLEVLDYHSSLAALTGMIGEIKNMSQGAMMPSIMQGIPPGSRTAGYAIQELAQAAKAKYQRPVANSERAHAEMMNFIFWLIEEKLDTAIYLLTDLEDESAKAPSSSKSELFGMASRKGASRRGYISLGPDDIRGYYAVECRITPRQPIDKIQEGTFLANMLTAGLVSKRFAMEEGLGIDDPEGMMDEIRLERLMESPEIDAWLTAEALKEANMEHVVADIQAAQGLMQQQMGAMQQAAMNGAGAGTNGNAGGVQSPGAAATTAPVSPQMDLPGGAGAPGQGMSISQPQAAQQLPKQYKQRGGPKPGNPQRPPARPGIAGFTGR